MPSQGKLMSIGALAGRTGLARSALRYYERVGLLAPVRRARGRRQYGPSAVQRVAFIQLCQDAGFRLREIHALLATGGRRTRPGMRLLEGKLGELDARIAQAQRARELVQQALDCPNPNLFACENFRAALQARLQSPGHHAVPNRFGPIGDSVT